MTSTIEIIDVNEIPEAIEDYFERFADGPQPDSTAELHRCGQKRYARLINCNGVLAVYDDSSCFVSREDQPFLYEEELNG